jgi:hypothetical protein
MWQQQSSSAFHFTTINNINGREIGSSFVQEQCSLPASCGRLYYSFKADHEPSKGEKFRVHNTIEYPNNNNNFKDYNNETSIHVRIPTEEEVTPPSLHFTTPMGHSWGCTPIVDFGSHK